VARKRWPVARQGASSRIGCSVARLSAPGGQVHQLTCALCGREAKGFGYVHELRWGAFPHHRFCSMACCEAGGALARRRGGVIDKTCMEERAVKDARRSLAEALTELGLMEPFHDRTAAEIDRLIEACVDGFQASMQRQAAERDPLDDPIPFS
jgi:hypothetical protein